MKRKYNKEQFITFKLFFSIVFLVIITILFVCAYKLYKDHNTLVPWSEVESVDDYTYIEVYKMSEKFAYYKDTNVGIHFVIEKEDTGLWHTYLIAINEKDYEKYKNIIDYTYERIKEEPKPIKAYGYPVIVDDKLKDLAIKNIPNFVPSENEVTITKDNYNDYLTNSYLDTTKPQRSRISLELAIVSILLFIVILLFINTLLLKNDNNAKKKKKRKR